MSDVEKQIEQARQTSMRIYAVLARNGCECADKAIPLQMGGRTVRILPGLSTNLDGSMGSCMGCGTKYDVRGVDLPPAT